MSFFSLLVGVGCVGKMKARVEPLICCLAAFCTLAELKYDDR